MNQNERDKWRLARAKGLMNFVFIKGGLEFGGTLFLVNIVINNLLLRRPWETEDVTTTGLICLAGGLLFGIIAWIIQEMRY